MMRNYLCLIVAVFVLVLVSVAFGQDGREKQQMLGMPRVTLDAENMPIRDALAVLFKDTGVKYTVPPGVTGSVRVRMDDVPLDAAVAVVSKAASLTYCVEDGVYVFSAGDIPPIVPLQVVALPAPSGGPMPMAPSPPPGGQLPGFYGPPGMPGMPGGTVSIQPAGDATFDIVLDNASLYEAIRQLMELSKLNYVLDLGQFGGEPRTRVAARMEDVALDDALGILAKAANLYAAKEGSIYFIRPQQGFGGPQPGMTAMPPLAGGVGTVGPCAKCGLGLQPDWKYCPRCGARPPQPSGAKDKPRPAVPPKP